MIAFTKQLSIAQIKIVRVFAPIIAMIGGRPYKGLTPQGAGMLTRNKICRNLPNFAPHQSNPLDMPGVKITEDLIKSEQFTRCEAGIAGTGSTCVATFSLKCRFVRKTRPTWQETKDAESHEGLSRSDPGQLGLRRGQGRAEWANGTFSTYDYTRMTLLITVSPATKVGPFASLCGPHYTDAAAICLQNIALRTIQHQKYLSQKISLMCPLVADLCLNNRGLCLFAIGLCH